MNNANRVDFQKPDLKGCIRSLLFTAGESWWLTHWKSGFGVQKLAFAIFKCCVRSLLFPVLRILMTDAKEQKTFHTPWGYFAM